VLHRWLVELSLITARRQDDAETEALRIVAYSSRLAAYPADVAHEVLLVRRWQWWPSWAELADACDELAEWRHRVRNTLANWPEDEARRRDEWRAQRAAEDAKLKAEQARAATLREAEQARAARCMSDEGCDDCFDPEVCARHRRPATSAEAQAVVAEFLHERRFN
jgi:hypothetical protein